MREAAVTKPCKSRRAAHIITLATRSRAQLALDYARGLEAAAPLHDRAHEPAGAVHVSLLLAGGADAGELKADVGHGR